MIDAATGQVLFAREADTRFVPASITKVMTTFVAFELIASHKLSPRRLIQVSDSAYKNWSGKGSSMGVQRGARIPVDVLLHGITTVSANDGSVVLAEGVAGSVPAWTALMNREARKLGMLDSHFNTPNGWMDDGRTFVTAHDLGLLARALVTRHPALYAHYIGHPNYTYNGITRRNHDPTIGAVPGADGIKTGFTNQAGYGYLGSAARNGRRIIMVVAGVDSGTQRKNAARAFMEWGFRAFTQRTLLPAHRRVANVEVQSGSALSVPVEAKQPVTALVAHGERPRFALTMRYIGPVRAPIAKGSEIAEVEVNMDGRLAYRMPLVASADVQEASLWARLRNGLVGLFR